MQRKGNYATAHFWLTRPKPALSQPYKGQSIHNTTTLAFPSSPLLSLESYGHKFTPFHCGPDRLRPTMGSCLGLVLFYSYDVIHQPGFAVCTTCTAKLLHAEISWGQSAKPIAVTYDVIGNEVVSGFAHSLTAQSRMDRLDDRSQDLFTQYRTIAAKLRRWEYELGHSFIHCEMFINLVTFL